MQNRFDPHSEVLRFAEHTIGPLFLHCRWIAQHWNQQDGFFIVGEKQSEPLLFYFHSPIMCMVGPSVFPTKCAYIAILADQTVLFGGIDLDEGLPISVRLAMYLAERERDPSGCRASCLTSELPFHTVLVPPPSPVVVVTESSGFYTCRPPHRCPFNVSSLVFVCITRGIRTFIRRAHLWRAVFTFIH